MRRGRELSRRRAASKSVGRSRAERCAATRLLHVQGEERVAIQVGHGWDRDQQVRRRRERLEPGRLEACVRVVEVKRKRLHAGNAQRHCFLWGTAAPTDVPDTLLEGFVGYLTAYVAQAEDEEATRSAYSHPSTAARRRQQRAQGFKKRTGLESQQQGQG